MLLRQGHRDSKQTMTSKRKLSTIDICVKPISLLFKYNHRYIKKGYVYCEKNTKKSKGWFYVNKLRFK